MIFLSHAYLRMIFVYFFNNGNITAKYKIILSLFPPRSSVIQFLLGFVLWRTLWSYFFIFWSFFFFCALAEFSPPSTFLITMLQQVSRSLFYFNLSVLWVHIIHVFTSNHICNYYNQFSATPEAVLIISPIFSFPPQSYQIVN